MIADPDGGKPAQAALEPELHTREQSRQTLVYLVARTGRLVRSMQDELLVPFELGATDYAVIAQVHFEGPQSTAELSRQLRLTAQAVGQAVAKLEQRALVSKQQSSQDRRVMTLTLTAEGEELMRRCTHELRSVEQALIADMTAREVQMLGILLGGALANLNTALHLTD